MAGRDVVAELAVNLTLETASFANGASVAEARAKTMEGRLSSLGSRAKQATSAISGMATGFAVGLGSAAVAGAGAALAAGLEYASSLGEVASQLGVTTRELQQYRYAATQAGVEQDTMDASLARLTKTLGLAGSGSAQAAAPFERLGISLKNADGSFKTAGQAIPEIAEKLKGIANPAERAALLTQLFGKSGQQLMPLLSEGAQGVNELAGAAEKLGIIISDDQIRRADEAADKWAAYKQVLAAKFAIGAVTGLEGLEKLDQYIHFVANNIREFRTQIQTAVKGIADNIRSIGPAFSGMASSAIASAQRLYNGVRDWLFGKLDAVWAGLKAKVQAAGRFFHDYLYDPVVGHSFVPDMVVEVGQWMGKLDGLMVDKAASVTKRAGDTFQAFRDRVKGLMGELFPEIARGAELSGKLNTLIGAENRGLLTGDMAAEARRRLFGATDLSSVPLMEDPGYLTDKLTTSIEDLAPVMDMLGEKGTKLAVNWEDAAQSIVGVLSSLFGGSKTGRILGAVLNAGMGIAKAVGAFGGARANGGPVVPGKTYLVGEQGPEYITPSRRGYVHPNGSGGFGGSTRLQIVPSRYFDLVVDGRAANVAGPMASRAAFAGAAGGVAGVNRQRRRSLVG